MKRKFRVQICYSLEKGKLSKEVINLHNQLRHNGINAYMDNFVAGIHTAHLFHDILKGNDYVIIVLTNNYIEKANVEDSKGEKVRMLLSYVKKFKDKIIPIIFEKIKELPFYVFDLNYIEFGKGDYSNNFERLLKRINN